MSCHVLFCHVMSCHDISCHIMSCHDLSCPVLSRHPKTKRRERDPAHGLTCHRLQDARCDASRATSTAFLIAYVKVPAPAKPRTALTQLPLGYSYCCSGRKNFRTEELQNGRTSLPSIHWAYRRVGPPGPSNLHGLETPRVGVISSNTCWCMYTSMYLHRLEQLEGLGLQLGLVHLVEERRQVGSLGRVAVGRRSAS